MYSYYGGGKLTLDNSIYLINKYCLRLPSDSLTQLTAKVEMLVESCAPTQAQRYKCRLYLPINSGVHEPVESGWERSWRVAQKSAAYCACLLFCARNEMSEMLEAITKVRSTGVGVPWAPSSAADMSSSLPNVDRTKRILYSIEHASWIEHVRFLCRKANKTLHQSSLFNYLTFLFNILTQKILFV